MAFNRNPVQSQTYRDEQVGDVLLDPITKTFRPKTEEELVRQELLRRIVDPRFFGWPQDLVEVEFKLTKVARSADRADIVLFVPSADMWRGRNNSPLLVFECKAPSITLTDTTHEQAIRYADQLDATWYGITNRRSTYFYQRTKDCWQEMETFPCFTNVIEGLGHIAKRMLEPAGRSRRPSKEELNQVIGTECPQYLRQHVRSLYELLLSENGMEIPVSGYGVEIREDLGSSFRTISDPTGYRYDVWLRSFVVRDLSTHNDKLLHLTLYPETEAKNDTKYGNRHPKTVLCVCLGQTNGTLSRIWQINLEKHWYLNRSRLFLAHLGNGNRLKGGDVQKFIASRQPDLISGEKIILGSLPTDSPLTWDCSSDFFLRLLSAASLRETIARNVRNQK